MAEPHQTTTKLSMSSLPSPTMEFTFGSLRSTPPFLFSYEIDSCSSAPSLKRPLAGPEPDGPAPKKRRLRLALTTSPLSRPFSTPRTSSLPDRTTSNRSKLGGISGAFRHSPWRPSSPSHSPSSGGTSSLLRKAAVLNRVQQRIDAACERNPNLRWEKERRQERELLLREGLEMRRMAALKDGLSPVNSTRPVVGTASPLLDPDLPPAAAPRLECVDCERRAVADTIAVPPTWCCKDGYPTPPASTCTVGLSNYDALDSEEEEKDSGSAALATNSSGTDDDATADTNGGPVDEGIRDIFDFLTPPAEHQTYLSFGDYGGDDDDDDDGDPGPSREDEDGPENEDEEPPAPSPAAATAVDTAPPPKQPCSSWGCQSAFWIPPPRLTGNDAALQCLLRQPRHHRRYCAMPAFVAVPPAL